MPSLSVVHAVPSRRRKDAPARSSPEKPSEPSKRPSASSAVRARLYVSAACDTMGVGLASSCGASLTLTLLGASTSSPVAQDGTNSACVSMPRKIGPLVPCRAQCSQMMCLMAQHVAFVERSPERGATMPRRAERHKLRGHRKVRRIGIAARDQLRHVDEHRRGRRLPRERADLHARTSNHPPLNPAARSPPAMYGQPRINRQISPDS